MARICFPAFPYVHFSKLSNDDVSALYAFFMTRAPVVAAERSSTIPFPLNIRALQAGWKLLFFQPGRFVPDPKHSAEWNRGAYLAEGLSHCGACHTPRGSLGAERRDRAYTGARSDGWLAPALGQRNTGSVPWSREDLVAYLTTGASERHGDAAGPMRAVAHGLSRLPASDVAAIATYVAGDPAAEHPTTQRPGAAREIRP